jgi:hypothetical protein
MKFGRIGAALIRMALGTGMVAAAGMAFTAAVYAQDIPFKAGERITYDLVGQIKEWRMKGTLGSAEVALVGLENLKGKSVYHAVASASSSLLMKSRYELKHVFHSWFDPKTFQTYKVEKIVKENEYTNHMFIDVDPKTGVVTEIDKGNPKGKKYSKPRNAYDFLSFFYWVRSMKQDKPFTCTLFNGAWNKQFAIGVTPGEETKVPLLDKKNKLKTIVMKENQMYGLEIRCAKDFNYIPFVMNVVNVQMLDVHVTGQGVITGYQPGK